MVKFSISKNINYYPEGALKITHYLYILLFAFSFSAHSADDPKNEIPCDQLTYKVNVHFAETARRGNGMVVFTNPDVRDTVAQNVQSINDALKTCGFAGNLDFLIPQTIGAAQPEPQSFFLLTVYNFELALSELALKEAMIKHGEPTSIIFFRQDRWQYLIAKTDELILNAQEWQESQTVLKRILVGLKSASFDVQALNKHLSVKDDFLYTWHQFKESPQLNDCKEETETKRKAFLPDLLQTIEAPLHLAQTETKLLSNCMASSSLTYDSLDQAFECHLKIRRSGITSCSQPLLVETEILFPPHTLVVADDSLNRVVINRYDNTHRIIIDFWRVETLQEIEVMLARLFQSKRNVQIIITGHDIPGEEVQNLMILGTPPLEKIRTSLELHLGAKIGFADPNLDDESLMNAHIIRVYRQSN